MNFRRVSWLAPLAATLTAGCFATRNDVRLLKADIERLHAEAEANRKTEADRTRADAARRDSINSAANRRFEAQITALADSLRAQGEEHSRFKATVTIALSELQLQLETIQQIVGVTQKQIRDANLRAEAMRESMTNTDADSGAAEGPRALYHIGMDQLQKGAFGQARGAFQELLTKFPNDSVLVDDALYQVGWAYEAEGSDAKADSVYALVVKNHPMSDRASNALYKRGMISVRAGRTSEARAIFNQLLREYSSSDEAPLARNELARLPRG